MFGRNKELKEKCFICDCCGDGYGLNDIGFIGVGTYCKYCNPLKPLTDKVETLVEWSTDDVMDIVELEDTVDEIIEDVTQLKKDLKYQQLHNQLVNNWFKKVEGELNELRENSKMGQRKNRSTSQQNDSRRVKTKKD